MPTKKVSQNSEPDAAVYISVAQLRARYGGVSHMFIERRLAADKDFPKPIKFGRLRFFKIDELIRWERKAAASAA